MAEFTEIQPVRPLQGANIDTRYQEPPLIAAALPDGVGMAYVPGRGFSVTPTVAIGSVAILALTVYGVIRLTRSNSN